MSAAAPAAPPSPARLRLFRLATLAVAPLLVLVLEGSLRLGGFGYPASFVVPDTVAGREVHRDNPHFPRRFFPPPLYRSPRPFALARDKAPNAYRIVVLGESAAMGDPAPAFGFGRILQAMLEPLYPERRIEVVNAAVTAINSHAVREIAADGARLRPDVFLVYMGHNEVVGPYGAGTVFHPFTRSLAVIRTHLLLKRPRVGQLADHLAARLRGAGGPERWEGMEMFLGHEVRASDPGLAAVRSHFRRNLEDVLAAAERAGARVLLSTVATNLGDQPPFASPHRAGLSAEEERTFARHLEAGAAREGGGRLAEALAEYERAAAVDDQHAELAYRRGRCLRGLGRHEEALRSFEQGRDLDGLRFRADSFLNAILREVATERRERGVALLDVEAAFRRESPHGVPGDELFLEHVHMTWEGNHRIAREALTALVALTPPSRPAPPLDSEEAARRLGFTPWHRLRMLREILDRTRRPPFQGQLGAAERRARLEAQVRALETSLQASRLAEAALAAAASASRDEDWERHEARAQLLEAAGRRPEALAEWRRVLEIVPHNHEAHGRLGVLLFETGRSAEARERFETALRLRPDVADSYNNLGAYHAGERRWGEAEAAYRRALAIDPRSPEALVNLATCLLEQARREEAVAQYRKAASRPTYSAAARYQLGLLADTLGLTREAEEHARGALELEPGHPGACELLAGSLRKSGGLDHAIASFSEQVRRLPSAAAHGTLAEILEERGRPEEAAVHSRHALELEPGREERHLSLGMLLGRSGRPREAAAVFEAAARAFPDSEEVHRRLAQAYREIPDAAHAIEAYRAIRRRWPQDWGAGLRLAWLLSTSRPPLRRTDEAVALAEEARRATGGRDAQVLNVLAAAYAGAGRFQDASRTAREAVDVAAASGQRELAARLSELSRRYAEGRELPPEAGRHARPAEPTARRP